jgi:pilus assembly protein FimV
MSSSTYLGRFALSAVAAAALCAASPAWALGLGRLAVQSALGEPLRAEIDVTSMTSEEAGSLRVRVAPSEAYRAAGIDYNAVLTGTQVTLARRTDGRPFLRLSSDRVVLEPFVDVILEMNWASGRLVREYTLLFDPPAAARAPAPAAAPVAPSIGAAPPAPRPAAPPPVAAEPRTPAPAPESRPAVTRAPAPAARPAATQTDSYEVRRGDTLTRIANQTLRPGVSLDQMLVALFRTNPQAFMNDNMNRLRAGAVLQVPSAGDAQGVPPAEARQVIQAQSSDFSSYRRRLATAAPPVKADEPARTATGQVQAQVDDRKQAAAAAPDKLTLTQGALRGASAAEAAVSKDTQQRDASTRVAELSRNVEELKQLAAGASAPAAAPAPVPASAPALPGVTAPVVVAPPAAPAASVVAPPAPVPAPAPAVASAPSPAPAVAAGDEPGWLDSLLDNPLVLPVAGLLLATLAGLGFYRARSRKSGDSGETSFLESRLQPDSFFGASGGQRIDTRDATGMSSSMSYSLSQLDAIGDVDPVAEADVYLAYGRDLQAEEILKEAMRSNPDRLAIRGKLLEVYAKRRDTKGYELLAGQLYAITKGEGEDWAKAQEQGRQIDPDNPMYKAGGRPTGAVAGATMGGEVLGMSTMPQSVLPSPSAYAAMDAPDTLPTGPVDVDLDLNVPVAGDLPPPAPPERTQPFDAGLDLSLPSIQGDLPAAAPAPSPAADFDVGSLSLDLDPPRVVSAPAPLAAAEPPASAPVPFSTNFGGLGGEDALLRKLELAEEFRQIGDSEGARDLLEEVVAQAGDGPLRAKAQGLLDSLA